MKPLIDKLKNAKLIAEEKIGFDQIVKHIERATDFIRSKNPQKKLL